MLYAAGAQSGSANISRRQDIPEMVCLRPIKVSYHAAIALTEKLGMKVNLLAFSLHPGVVQQTNLFAFIRADPTASGLGKG